LKKLIRSIFTCNGIIAACPVPGTVTGSVILPATVSLLSRNNLQAKDFKVAFVFGYPPVPSLGLTASTFSVNETGKLACANEDESLSKSSVLKSDSLDLLDTEIPLKVNPETFPSLNFNLPILLMVWKTLQLKFERTIKMINGYNVFFNCFLHAAQ
jgi:hypothetical protein